MSQSKSPDKTFADYLAGAVCPLLIMALIGSLVFFLVQIVFAGHQSSQLHWMLAFFIFGAVLVSRISMIGKIAKRAPLYAILLGLLMWMALIAFVEAPLGNWSNGLGPVAYLAFIFVIWWSAYRLTKDCTLGNENEESAGAGLLDAAGMGAEDEAVDGAAVEKPEKVKPGKRSGGLANWWKRYKQYQKRKKRGPRSQGVWVIYFSLAALPIFGIGQSLIPPEDTAARRYAFWLMIIYVASGLGLMLTATFLGLRRYLRQRKLKMPSSIAGTWLFVGTFLIVTMLIVGAMMPRPYPEYSLVRQVFQFGAQRKEAPKQEGGQAGKRTGSLTPVDSKANGDKNKQTAPLPQPGQGAKNSGSNSSGPSNGSGSNKNGKNGPHAKSGTKQGGQPNAAGNSAEKGQDEPKSSQESRTHRNRKSPSDRLGAWLNILKWIVLVLVALAVLFFVGRQLLRFLANFTYWARNLLNWFARLWAALLRGKTRKTTGPAVASDEIVSKPFEYYHDPFQTGLSNQMSAAELVHYSFQALQAWGRERGLTRTDDETATEYARRVSDGFPALEREGKNLAGLYAAAAYAPDWLSFERVESLREFWYVIAEVAGKRMTAGSSR